MKTVLLTALFCATAATASATVLVQSSFEPATYSLGQLSGQDGWIGDPQLFVQNTSVLTGTQAAGLNAAGLIQRKVFHSVAYDSIGNPQQILNIDVSMYLSSDAANNIWDIVGYGSTSGFQGQLVVTSNHVFQIGNTGGFVSGPTINVGQWYNYRASLNFTTQTVSAFVNGNFAASIAFSQASTDLTSILIGLNNAGANSAGSAYWDDVLVSTPDGAAVPEPSSALLVLVGGGMVTLFARKRARG